MLDLGIWVQPQTYAPFKSNLLAIFGGKHEKAHAMVNSNYYILLDETKESMWLVELKHGYRYL